MQRFRTTPADHRFFGLMSIAAVVVIVVGFGRTYPPHLVGASAGLPGIVHVHAAVFSVWLVLFVAQAALVARGRVDLHRRLGLAGVLLAALMLVVGVATAVAVARQGRRGIPGVEFPDAGGFLFLNLASIFVFTLLVLAGWYWRRSPQAHKRLMLMATVGGLAPPGIARLPGVAGNEAAVGALVMAFILAGPLYDLVTRRRVHVAYAGSLLLIAAILPPVTHSVSATPGWHRIASWMTGPTG